MRPNEIKTGTEIMKSFDNMLDPYVSALHKEALCFASQIKESDVAEIGNENCAKLILMLATCKAGFAGFFPNDPLTRRVHQRLNRRTLKQNKG